MRFNFFLTFFFFLLFSLALTADANFLWPTTTKRQQNSENSLDERHSALLPNHFYNIFRNLPAFNERFSTLTKLDDSKGWVFQLDVPGLSLDEISVHAEGQVLVIRGEHNCGRNTDQTCVDRRVYEEIRLSESADLDTAEAELDLGVLRVHIRPKSGSSSRGRVVKILDRARGKARSWGESLKNTFTWQHDANVADSVKHSAAEFGSDVEERVTGFIKQIQHHMKIPHEKQREFADRVHAKSQGIYQKLKEKSLTPNEAYNHLYDNAEEILNQIKQQPEDLRYRAERVADDAWDRTRCLKEKAGRGAESAARNAWDTACNVKNDAQRKFDHASQFAKRQFDYAEDAAVQAAQSAKSTASDLKDKVETKAGDVYDKTVDLKNSAEQKVFEVVQEGKETVQEKAGQAKQALGNVAQQATETAGQVADKIGDVKDTVTEKVGEKVDQAKEALGNAYQQASDKAGDVKDTVKEKVNNMTEDVKEKVGDIKDDVKSKIDDAIDTTVEKVDETAHNAKLAADEAEHRASINAQEASHTASVVAGEASYAADTKAENMADTIKRKLGLY